MSPWWTAIDPQAAVWLDVAAATIGVAIVYAILAVAREGHELVRRRVLEQLALAAGRGLPLVPALLALGRDLVATGPRGPVFRRLARWQRAKDRELVDDIAAHLQEGDLAKALA